MTIKCAECGVGTVRLAGGAGRRMRYRQLRDLELPAEMELPTCDHCNELWLGPQELEQVDAALREAFSRELSRRAERCVRSLAPVIQQRELERLLGLSGGLLSKIKSGKDTSPLLVSTLMLLAENPARLEELRALWSGRERAPAVDLAVPMVRDAPNAAIYRFERPEPVKLSVGTKPKPERDWNELRPVA